MLDPLQELGRRAFLFSTFTGLAYVDIMLLHPHHIAGQRTAGGYIRINRKKTNVGGIHPPASDSGTDTRPLQHDGRHEARVPASEPR